MSGVFLRTQTRSRTPSADTFVLTLWTNDPELARRADAAHVDRIGVDLERNGKAERQEGRGTWISPHCEEDLDVVGAALSHAELFARVNPMHPGSACEVERALARGARVLMLPMVESAEQARGFVEIVDGSATVVALVEPREGVARLPEIVAVDGVDEVHLGINDLALSMGVRNRWLALDGDLAIVAGRVVRAAGKRFGLGAVGRPGDRGLPVPVELVYAECARAGATAALLARSFFRDGLNGDLETAIARLRRELAACTKLDEAELAAAHRRLLRCAATAPSF